MTEKIIIVATDFSAAASNAAHYAAEMAVAVDAKLVLLHVYQPSYFYADIPVALNDEEIKLDTLTSLSLLKEELLGSWGKNLFIETMVRVGAFYQQLEKVCDVIEPYTVVIGSHGKTAAQQLLFGSHTAFTMRHLRHPLIAVQKNATFSSIKKIGLACDVESDVRHMPLDKVKALVKDLHASLHILSAVKHNGLSAIANSATGQIKNLLADLKPSFHFIPSDETDGSIITFAEENGINLLIVLPKKYSLLQYLIHKSHTRQLVLHSSVPVMAIHSS